MSCSVDIRMLGGFELRDQHGQLISLSVRKAEAVLALLALDPGRAFTRSKLCSMLWPNVSEAQARHSLRQALVSIRKVLPDAIVATPRTVMLQSDGACVDTTEVARWLSDGSREALDKLAHTYRGDLLDGIASGEEPFEQWLTLERERIRGAVVRGLCRLIELHTNAAAWSETLQVAKQVLHIDALHEPALRACMSALAQLGRRSEALQHYQKYARTLRQTLGVDPEPETRQLQRELAAQQTPVPPAPEPAPRKQPLPSTQTKISSLQLRNPELAQLRAAFEGAGASHGALCLIEGEAGVGKSHVCAEFSQLITTARVLRGRCFESEQVLPFSCWSDLLGHAALAEDTATLSRLQPEQRRELARLLPQLNETAPLTAADDPLALFHALAAVFARWTEQGPVCVVLEDLHWADEMSLRFLCYLTRRQRCFVLGTARSEHGFPHEYLPRALAELEREGRLSRVPLAPFSHAQTSMLAQHHAQQLALNLPASAWVERIWELSEGNALVISECVRALAQPEIALDLSRLSVPERMRALIRQRIATLSHNARELAALAAVYGRELHLQLMASLMDNADLSVAVQELVGAQLVRVRHERLLFAHDRVRETLYGDLAPALRQHLHGRIASALTPLAVGPTLGHAGYHHAKAGNPQAAVELLRKFAEHATRTYALGEALAALDEASLQAQQLPARERARALTDFAVHQAFCLAFLGRFDAMAELLERRAELAEAAEAPQLTAAFHFWHGFSSMFHGRLAQSEKQAQRALAVAAESGERELLGFAYNLASHLHLLQMRFDEAQLHAERALELLRTSERSEPLMFAYINVCFSHCVRGQTSRALEAAAMAERDAARADSQRGVAMAALVGALAHIALQRWDLVLAATQRALAASQTPFTLGPAVAMMAFAQLLSGDAAAALALAEAVLGQMGPEKPLTIYISFRLLQAEALLQTGALERAREVATDVVSMARTMVPVGLGFALRTQGLAELRLGELEVARVHLEEALAYYEKLEMPLAIPLCLVALAELEREHADRARAHLERAHAIYASLDHAVGARDTLERIQRLPGAQSQ